MSFLYLIFKLLLISCLLFSTLVYFSDYYLPFVIIDTIWPFSNENAKESLEALLNYNYKLNKLKTEIDHFSEKNELNSFHESLKSRILKFEEYNGVGDENLNQNIEIYQSIINDINKSQNKLSDETNRILNLLNLLTSSKSNYLFDKHADILKKNGVNIRNNHGKNDIDENLGLKALDELLALLQNAEDLTNDMMKAAGEVETALNENLTPDINVTERVMEYEVNSKKLQDQIVNLVKSKYTQIGQVYNEIADLKKSLFSLSSLMVKNKLENEKELNEKLEKIKIKFSEIKNINNNGREDKKTEF